MTEKQRTDRHGQRRIGEQDQSFQAGGNVAQADEVEYARAIITEQAQHHDGPPVATGQRRGMARFAQAHPDEGWQREHHAQRQQRHCCQERRRAEHRPA